MSSNEIKEPSLVPDESRHSVWIHELNDDCLVRIFQYLPLGDRLTTERVCRRWKRVSKLAWNDMKHLNLTKSETCNTDFNRLPGIYKNHQSVATILLRCGRYLDQLTIGEPCHYTILPFVAKHCQNLTRLEISFDFDEHRNRHIRTMPKLKYFGTMTGVFDDALLVALPSNNSVEIHLEAFDEIVFHNSRERGTLPSMTSVCFQNLENLSVLSLHDFELSADILEVISAKTKLTFLSLENCLGPFEEYLTFGSLANLEHLDLGWILEIEDVHIIQVLETCKKLKYLNLDLCGFVTDEGVKDLWKLPQLEQLNVSGTDITTGDHLSRLYNLKQLDWSCCEAISDEGFITFLKSAVRLEYLSLRETRVTKEVFNVANENSRRRTNGIPLRLLVDNCRANDWNEYDSPLLIIETEENLIHWPATSSTVHYEGNDFDMYDDDDDYEFEYDYGSDVSSSDDPPGELSTLDE